jgi:hypothetical protein
MRTPREVLLFNIPRTYPFAWTDDAIYEATRGFWVIGSRREGIEIACGVFHGSIVEVYRIKRWLPAGTLPYRTRDASPYRGSGRWEFEGVVATDVRREYIGRDIPTVGQNPVRYASL